MRKLAFGLAALGGAGFFGCTALLGTFEVSATAMDAGSDGRSDASDPLDSGDAGDAAADYLLTCVAQGTPMRLDEADLVDGSGIDRPVGFLKAGQNLRVVYRKRGSLGFFIQTFNPRGGFVPNLQHNQNAGQVLDIQRVGGDAIGVLTFDYDLLAPGSGNLRVYVIPDDDLMSIGSQVTISTSIMVNNVPGVRLSGALQSFGSDDFFVAFAYPSTMAGETQIGVIRRKAGGTPLAPMIIAMGLTGKQAAIRDAARGARKVFLFDEAEPGGGGTGTSTSYYPVPDDPGAGYVIIEPVAMSQDGGVPSVEIASFSTSTSIALAMAEIDLDNPNNPNNPMPIVLRAGEVPSAKLASGGIRASDIPFALGFSSAKDMPFDDGASSRFLSSNDFVAIGPGLQSTTGAYLLWYDTKVRALRARNTSANPLFSERTIAQSYALFDSQPTSLFTQLSVLFTEKDAMKETMYFSQVRCTK